jgi:hypothetical protein
VDFGPLGLDRSKPTRKALIHFIPISGMIDVERNDFQAITFLFFKI